MIYSEIMFKVVQEDEVIATTTNKVIAINTAKAQAKTTGKPTSIIAEFPGKPDQTVLFYPDGSSQDIWRIDEGERFEPIVGQVYANRGGGQYLCMGKPPRDNESMNCGMAETGRRISTVFRNVSSGWTFTARNVIRYVDGTIEWDHSIDGRFTDPEGKMVE